MFPGTTIMDYVFWMSMGALQVLVVAGAYAWLKHYDKYIPWWQMALLYGGFASLCLAVAGGATLAGEYETQAGLYFTGFMSVLIILAMAVMIRLFIFKKATKQ